MKKKSSFQSFFKLVPFVPTVSIQCNHCDNRFETKGKRDRHTIEEHGSTVMVGETNVSRTSSGFLCPCCRKCLKNAKTLKEHLAKRQLLCLFVYDSVGAIAPQSDPRENLSSLHVKPDALTSTVATAETTSSANTSKEPPLIESTAPNVSTASTFLISSPTSSTLFSSIVLDGLSFSPPTMEDRLIFSSIDVSVRLYEFQLDVQSRLREGAAFTIEEHMQHILALLSVLLLKPVRTHEDLHKHIDLNTCEGLRQHTLSKQQTVYQPLPT